MGKTRDELILPSALARWVEENMAGPPDLSGVHIYCSPGIPFDWLPGDRRRYIGITLWNSVWIRTPFALKTADNYELIFHELVHVRQFQRNPIRFPIMYLVLLALKGYWNHPAEIEARAVAAEMRKRYFSSASSAFL